MNYEINQLLKNAEGRYLTDLESQKLIGYAAGIRRRLEVARNVERAEAEIVGANMRAIKARYPELESMYGEHTNARIVRDQTFVLRYAVLAMVQRDPDFIRDKLSLWLATILAALCDLEHVIYAMEQIIEACRQHLEVEDAEELVPYLQVNLQAFEARSSTAA
ncbi:MAG: hypothetical protein AAGF11_19885 [Myxococcota bacterium]